MPWGSAWTMAHELGHNLGFEHDDEIGPCVCHDPSGSCIMQSAIGSVLVAASLLPAMSGLFAPRTCVDISPHGRFVHRRFVPWRWSETSIDISLVLGMEVRLSPWDIGLDGDPAPFPKREAEAGGRSPNFRPMAIVAERLDGS